MGRCYYCNANTTGKQVRQITTGELKDVCDYHHKVMKATQDGKNIGYQAGIG